MKRIVDMSSSEARCFLLKTESYSTIPLPPYFDFSRVLKVAEKYIDGRKVVDVSGAKSSSRVNYVLLSNKDGSFGWRPLQLVNPILYVDLVQRITEDDNWCLICSRFQYFQKIIEIECVSYPLETEKYSRDLAETILNWKSSFERKSITCALKYSVLVKTDISNCYGSVYTHSIAWALHGKDFMKERTNRNNKKLLGNIIDSRICGMQWGQTNGIPQGSVLMDFIVELILGYADERLSVRLREANVGTYKILRFRDDYRIFTNNTQDSRMIVQHLSSVLCDLNFKLNAEKTSTHSEIILNSLKGDVFDWMEKKDVVSHLSIWENALYLYRHTVKYGVTGTIIVPLTSWCDRLRTEKIPRDLIFPLLSIVSEIAFRNPKAYPPCMAAIAILIMKLPWSEAQEVGRIIRGKFNQLPNAGYLQIWLQRIFPSNGLALMQYQEELCGMVNKCVGDKLWSFDWVKNERLKEEMASTWVVNEGVFKQISPLLSKEELHLFIAKSELVYL